jgi:MoxR-like ATPase
MESDMPSTTPARLPEVQPNALPAAAPDTPLADAPPHEGWLARLGLQGLTSIEPLVLAALATELPLLLIGPHGTAKSLLLTKVAEALGLGWRHYNASLLNFDDLVGFPVAAPGGALQYLKTPAAIWGAGAVIFDEISRCRPDVQNKLFPIIHERKVQGLALEGLRHRWAAMNPPCSEDEDNGYGGSEPLDRALADRFALVVTMPEWSGFSRAEQLAVIRSEDRPVDQRVASYLLERLSRTKDLLRGLGEVLGAVVADYVHVLMPLLLQAGLALSPRRGNLLHRTVLAVHAARLASSPDAALADSALQALQNGLPQRAEGLVVPEVKVLAAHREAMRALKLAPADPLRAILAATDPLERIKLALRATRLAKGEFSRVVADTLAQLPPGAREAAVAHLFETGAVGRLNAAVASQAGDAYRDIVTPAAFSETLHASHSRYRAWSRMKDLLSRLDPADPRAHLQANALASLFARKQLHSPEDAERAFHTYAQAAMRLRLA